LNDWAFSIQQATDVGFILAGYSDDLSWIFDDFWILKLDSEGRLIGNYEEIERTSVVIVSTSSLISNS
jgi:hypothetical protein